MTKIMFLNLMKNLRALTISCQENRSWLIPEAKKRSTIFQKALTEIETYILTQKKPTRSSSAEHKPGDFIIQEIAKMNPAHPRNKKKKKQQSDKS